MDNTLIQGVAGLKILAAGRLHGLVAGTVAWIGPHPGFDDLPLTYTGVGNYQVTLSGCLANLTACPVATSGTAGLIASVVRTAAGAYGPPLVHGSLQVLLMQDSGVALDGDVDLIVFAV